VIGVHLLLSSQAQSPYASIRADQGTLTAPATTKPCSGSSDGSCVQFGQGAISFNVVGNKIMESNGTQFVPYGFVVPCAANFVQPSDVSSLCQSGSTENSGSDILTAAAQDWHANIVRLQVSQENLFSETTNDTCSSNPGSVNQNYLKVVDGLVNEANSLGMVAIISLQEELAGGCAFPTSSSTAFWHYMANYYKNNPEVFFDLYNEPQLSVNATGGKNTTGEANLWNIWQNGGTAITQTDSAGISTTTPPATTNYVGMQTLIDTIRGQGASNIVIAEGNTKDHDLSGVPTHVLTGGNVAYGNEPNLNDGDTTQAGQLKRFGQYAATWPIMPEAFLDQYGTEACDPNSATDIPELFSYLKSLNMGLISWSLSPGVDIQATSSDPRGDLDLPTDYSAASARASNYSSSDCPTVGGSDTSTSVTFGPGQLIQQYYTLNSIQF
ncbi:MAG TPA: cellulase family glycosylhydrolase, partial [Candidatus Saccharimonadales bacterium]|nr:cellulase family glycosylhydrolase [Candidatus Saccharimonadales bacterium]